MNKVQKQIQKKMLEALGMDKNETEKRNREDSRKNLSSSEKKQLEGKIKDASVSL